MVVKEKKQEPLVSIIIPVYNVAPYLREALNSVVKQTYKNLDIIIIDDGSTDRSGEVCDEYSFDSRITIIHQKHQGVSTARNAGLNIAKGDYVAFLDPDDTYHPSFIRILLGVGLREKADIVICRYNMLRTVNGINSKVKRIRRLSSSIRSYDRGQALRALSDGIISVAVWNKLYKSELWRDIRFPEGYNHAEDWVATYQVFDRSKTVNVIDLPLYNHRKRPGSLTTILSEKSTQDQNNAFLFVEQYIEAHIPEVFTKDHLTRGRQAHLRAMMVQFINTKDILLSRKLKREIVFFANQIKIDSFRTRVGYHMVLYCPWLMKLIYPIYAPIRLLVWRIAGR